MFYAHFYQTNHNITAVLTTNPRDGLALESQSDTVLAIIAYQNPQYFIGAVKMAIVNFENFELSKTLDFAIAKFCEDRLTTNLKIK